jgi:NADPH-dependent ferric siderophore reductase
MLNLSEIQQHLTEIEFGIPCVVTYTEYIAPRLKRVRFEGDFLRMPFFPGHAIGFRVGRHDFRHYTPVFADGENGICEVLFYLHGHGPGSRWAASLNAGQHAWLSGTSQTRLLTDNHYHFFFGDETSLGLFRHMKNVIDDRGDEYLGILELDKDALHWPEVVGLSVETVIRSGEYPPASEAISCLQELDERLWRNWKHATFYLAGSSASVRAFRLALIIEGVNDRAIKSCPYWAEGKHGLYWSDRGL